MCVGVLVDVWGGVVLGVCDVCFSVVTVSGSMCVCVRARACVRAHLQGERSDRAIQSCIPSGFPFSPRACEASKDFKPTYPAGNGCHLADLRD